MADVLGRQVTRSLRSLVVVTFDERRGLMYRGATSGDKRVCVVVLHPWDGEDPEHLAPVCELSRKAELAVVDTINDMASGSFTKAHARALEGFPCPVVGLIDGNETKVGVGPTVLWSNARQRFWHESKFQRLHALDSGAEPWPVSIEPLASVLATIATCPEGPEFTVEQVRKLGHLAQFGDRRGGPQAILSALLGSELPGVNDICGREITSSRELVPSVEHYLSEWEIALGLRRGVAPPLPDEAPF